MTGRGVVLAPPGPTYDPRALTEAFRQIALALNGSDQTPVDAPLVVTAPNGSRWKIVVSNTGVLSTVAA